MFAVQVVDTGPEDGVYSYTIYSDFGCSDMVTGQTIAEQPDCINNFSGPFGSISIGGLFVTGSGRRKE
jgi:hypothetical protein